MSDAKAWADVRRRNAAWLTPWEATLPPGDRTAPKSFRGLVRDLHRQARERRALPFAVTACGGGGGDENSIVIGTKFDQPGLGLKNPDGKMSGFDVDVATYVAKELGYTPEQIEWKESPSGQRETLIQNDQVKFIAATYSITDARKEKVSFAGPYLVTGQSLLVKADNTDITGATISDLSHPR